MNLQRIVYPVLIAGAAFGLLQLFAHGLAFLGFVLAGVSLSLAAHLYGPDQPLPPLSKEEELAAWGVRWELDNPAAPGREPASSAPKPRLQPRMHRGV